MSGFTLEKLQGGDRAAWDAAYDYYTPWLQKLLKKRARSVPWPDLEQIAVDSFNKLPKSISEVQGGNEGLTKFLITIAFNQLLDHLDKQRSEKRGADRIESLNDQPPGTVPESDLSTPSQNIEATELAFYLEIALTQIPENWCY